MKAHHHKKVKHYNIPGHAHELTFSCYKRQPLLNSTRVCNYLIDAIGNSREKYDYYLWAYVIMPEHVHLLIQPTQDQYSIEVILHSIKQSVSRRCLIYLRKHSHVELEKLTTGLKSKPYRFWMAGSGYDRNVTTDYTLKKMVDYIHNNPVRRGLVENPEDWKWSSYQEWHHPGAGPVSINRSSFPF